MRLLIVSQYFWPESFLINDLALGLRACGHEVTVLTGVPNYPQGRFYPGYRFFSAAEDYQGITVLRVPIIPRRSATPTQLLINYVSFTLSATLLGPWKYRQRPDAIIVFQPSPATVGIPAIVLAQFRRCPVFFWVQDLWPAALTTVGRLRSSWLIGVVDQLVRFIYRHCHRLLVQSPGFAEYVRQQGVPGEKVVLMPNWAADTYQPVELANDAPEQRELPRGFRLLFAGNIGQAQAWQTWVAAAERTRHRGDIHWVVIGDGREREALARCIQERGLGASFHLLGCRPAEAMPRYFAAASALLVSLRDCPVLSRTIPSKLQAYLACGRPVIAALAGDGATVVREAQAGVVVPPENPQALAEAVLSLADSSDQVRHQMGARARAYYQQHFSRERLLARWNQLLSEIMTDKGNEPYTRRRLDRCAA